MFTNTTPPITAVPSDRAETTVGTPQYSLELGFGVMNTNAAFNAAVSARVDSATRPADDAAKGRAYFERGRANQIKLRAVAVGTGTLKERVSVWTPNLDGTVWVLELSMEITWTFSGTGRVAPAALVNDAAGSVRYANAFASLVDHTPLNRDSPLRSEPGNAQPCWCVFDPLGGTVVEREGAIESGGITSFNFITGKL